MPSGSRPGIVRAGDDPAGRRPRIEVDAAGWAPPADAAGRARSRQFISLVLLGFGGTGLWALLKAVHAGLFSDLEAAGDHLVEATVFLPFGAWGFMRATSDARGARQRPPGTGDETPSR